MVPIDHRYMISGGKQELKRKFEAKFDDPDDYPTRLRRFLVRENALQAKDIKANPEAESAIQLSETKMRLAVKALCLPLIDKSFDEIMREEPKLDDGQGTKVTMRTKYKKKPAK